MKRYAQRQKKAEMTVPGTIMSVVVLSILAIVIIWGVVKTGLLDGGQKAVSDAIGGLKDADHDGIKNDVDQCMVAACDPADRVNEVDRDPNSMYYGCLPTQDVTRSPYADVCNRREDSTATSPRYVS